MLRVIIVGVVVLMSAAADAAVDCSALLRRQERIAREIARECAVATPTPAPTRHPGPTAMPVPCDGNLAKAPAGYQARDVTLDVGVERTLCFDVHAYTAEYLEMYTINKANTSCSDLAATLEAPSGARQSDFGPAPVARLRAETGRWRLRLYLQQGCNRYDFFIPGVS